MTSVIDTADLDLSLRELVTKYGEPAIREQYIQEHTGRTIDGETYSREDAEWAWDSWMTPTRWCSQCEGLTVFPRGLDKLCVDCDPEEN